GAAPAARSSYHSCHPETSNSRVTALDEAVMTDRPGTQLNLDAAPVRFAQTVDVDAAGLTHLGLVRQSNEDHFLISRLGRFFETVSTSLSPDDLPVRTD